MLGVGDIHLYVSDFDAAMRFWSDGLRLAVTDREVTASSAFARLDFPDGGPSLLLIGRVDAWEPDEQPPLGSRPGTRFDVLTADFASTLARLLEHGGRQVDEIESYEGAHVVALTDPDGNAFELVEITPDQIREHAS